MSLRIEKLRFRNFRSYKELNLSDIGPLTILVGPNAIGKTNIVEGIQLLTALTSFRHATLGQLVKHGEAESCLETTATDGNRLLEFSLALDGHSRKYRLNGKSKRPVELKGIMPSVAFTPDDLVLVKGSPSNRRRALDLLGSQVNANYYTLLKDYEKVLRHKNKLLKEEASPLLVDSINEMLLTCGAQLTCYRYALFGKLIPYVKSRYEELAGGAETFGAGYVPSWMSESAINDINSVSFNEESRELHAAYAESGVNASAVAEIAEDESAALPEKNAFKLSLANRDVVRAAMEEALVARGAEERSRKRAIVGPHADSIEFTINGMNTVHFASQGQQRSVVLAFKLAEAEVIEEMLGQKPILLLDDVMSELDGARREALVGYIAEETQTFITTANLAYFDEGMLARANIIELARI